MIWRMRVTWLIGDGLVASGAYGGGDYNGVELLKLVLLRA